MSLDAYLATIQALQAAAWPAGTPREPQYPLGRVPLTDYLRHWAQVQPEAVAIEFYGHRLTWSELDRLSDRCAALLAEHGIRPGDRVAVYLPNCPQLHIAFLGILKCGAVHAPVSPLARGLDLAHQLRDCGATALIGLDQLLPLVQQVRAETALAVVFGTSLGELAPFDPELPLPDLLRAPTLVHEGAITLLPALRACTAPAPTHPVRLDDIAALNYTGGTTGLPKGCVHTHGDMLYTCASFVPAALGLRCDDVLLNFLPEFWIAGENAGLLFPLYAGCRLVLMARWDAEAFMALVQRHRVSHCGLLVDSAAEVLDHPRAAAYDLGSLRVTGSISFTKKLTLDYRARWRALAGTTLFEFAYGMTETHTCDTFTAGLQQNDADLRSAPTFVGLPVPGTQFKVCDFASGQLLPVGAEGELCVRSPALMRGYWQRPEESAAVLREGWLHTGDIGQITEQGFIRYLGRRKEMLKVNGMSVFPSELEALLGQHPAILASAVIGAPDAERGQRPLAFVVLRPDSGEDAASLQRWCRDGMAGYKVPEVRVVAALPMTATGKVRKDALEQQA